MSVILGYFNDTLASLFVEAKRPNSGETLKLQLPSKHSDVLMDLGKTRVYGYNVEDETTGNPEPSFSLSERRRCNDLKGVGDSYNYIP